jgi:hypothetical protein
LLEVVLRSEIDMDITSFFADIAIPLTTVILSGAGAYVGAQRGKTASYREALYAKQLEAGAGMVEAMDAIVQATGDSFKDAWSRFNLVWTKWSIYLPAEVETKLANFQKAAGDILISGDPYIRSTDLLTVDDSYFKRYECIGDAHFKAISALREMIKVEPLSRETVKLIGEAKKLEKKLELPA